MEVICFSKQEINKYICKLCRKNDFFFSGEIKKSLMYVNLKTMLEHWITQFESFDEPGWHMSHHTMTEPQVRCSSSVVVVVVVFFCLCKIKLARLIAFEVVFNHKKTIPSRLVDMRWYVA